MTLLSSWRRGALLFLAGPAALAAAAGFNVRDYGATGDGRTLETAAFRRAVAACAAAGGGEVVVPPGRYLTGTIELKSRVGLEVGAGAVILGSENPADYPATPNAWGEPTEMIAPLIYAADAEDVAIEGRGTIDGQGAVWWRRLELADPRRKGPALSAADQAEAARVQRGRPRLIRLVRCQRVLISGLTLRDAADWTIHPLLCDGVRIVGVSIYAAPGSHNTDGIDPESCREVHILGCRIDTGDDCVTLKSGLNEAGRRMGRPTEDVTIANCVMYRGHGGVTIGSEMSGGVRNVTITNCVFHGTDTGLRIKSQRGRGGVVEGVVMDGVVMQDVREPFQITTFYMGHDRPSEVHPVDEGTPRYRDFHFSNITARGARSAGFITGLREMPIEDLTFSHVRIQAGAGFTCTNASQVAFYDSTIDTVAGPALVLRQSREIDSARLRTLAPHPGVPLVADDSR